MVRWRAVQALSEKMRTSTIPLNKIKKTDGPVGNTLYVMLKDEKFYVHSGEGKIVVAGLYKSPTDLLEVMVVENDADLEIAQIAQPRIDLPRGIEENYAEVLGYLIWKSTTQEGQ